MHEIVSFPFNKDDFTRLKSFRFGRNWPVVYVLENKKEMYIGQTVNAQYRAKQHYENPDRRKLDTIHILTDEEFNVSAALDIESWLIQYIAADGKYSLQNGNGGLKNHNYYDKVKYQTKFESFWDVLREKGLVANTLDYIKNTDLFKYSPYKSLTDDQLFVAKSIARNIINTESGQFLVHGRPGTGKTILATYLCKYLTEKEETKHLKIGLVVPMASLRGTLRSVFAKVKGLRAGMVIGPNDVARNQFDILIIDESHRLQRRKGIMGYGSYDEVNRLLNLPPEATQLDWMLKTSKYQIFLYDANQSIKPADVRKSDFEAMSPKQYRLKTQMRIGAGDAFVDFIEAVFDNEKPETTEFPKYDFKLFDDVAEMVKQIKEKDKKHKLARLVAGYAWPWATKNGASHDIEIGDTRLAWNSTTRDWVNSSNAVNEVGCIHTVQGYDLNYVGVIIGPELSYDHINKKMVVDRSKYFDTNGRNGITDPTELEAYIINIYKTLLTRGVLGTYVYIVDDNLKKYFKEILSADGVRRKEKRIESTNTLSPYQEQMIELPLYDSVGCGELMNADPISHETYSVPASLVKPGAKYFVLRTSGDSMNLLGIEDGDYILCQKNYQASSGSNAIVLIGNEATLKEIHYEANALLLKPKSTNLSHQPYRLVEGDEFKVLGMFVKKL